MKKFLFFLSFGGFFLEPTTQMTFAQKTAIQKGKKLFSKKGCDLCHSIDSSEGLGPSLNGIFGQKVWLANRQQKRRDKLYFQQKIVNANSWVTQRGPNIMPIYSTLSKSEVFFLVSYIESLTPKKKSKFMKKESATTQPTKQTGQ